MLDYNYRSRCCLAPIRLGNKTKKGIRIKVWVCVRCKKADIDIISKEEAQLQGKNRPIEGNFSHNIKEPSLDSPDYG